MLVTVSNKLSNWGTQSLVLLFGYPYESPPIDARSRPPLLTLRAERRDELSNLARIAAPLLLPRRMRFEGVRNGNSQIGLICICIK